MAYLIISHRNITVNIYFHILVATHSSLKSPKPLTSLHLIQIRAWNFGLVGGDLGPRLLPMGSLAGLLWLEMLRRHGVDVSVGRFVRVGLLVAIPTIAVSLAILSLY